MGGISGQADLLANNTDGLVLTSLHIGVDDLNLGALEIKDLANDYTRTGDKWTGMATLYVPGGSPYFKITANVEFDNGDFTMGSFQAGVGFPGDPDLHRHLFHRLRRWVRHPSASGKRVFYGSADFGAIPQRGRRVRDRGQRHGQGDLLRQRPGPRST